MIIIDDAGTGAIVGVPVVVGLKNGIVKSVKMKDLKGSSATAETFQLLDMFDVKKDEEIRICRGKVFVKFCYDARLQGYTNITQMKIEGKLQDIAEDVYMESLYSLGMDRRVRLYEKEYKQLFDDIINQLMLNSKLWPHVRPHFQVNPTFTYIVNAVTRLENEFLHVREGELG